MRIPKQIERALEATGLPYRIEKGTIHRKIIVGGKFVGILPYGKVNEADRANKNVVAQIRRAAL